MYRVLAILFFNSKHVCPSVSISSEKLFQFLFNGAQGSIDGTYADYDLVDIFFTSLWGSYEYLYPDDRNDSFKLTLSSKTATQLPTTTC